MQDLKINFEFTNKQLIAYKILEDKITTELLFGGGAGGGKSRLGCMWLILGCIKYAGSRWVMARAVLKALKQTTLLTFFDICKEQGIIQGEHFDYKAQDGVIKWWNGSEIYLKDLAFQPSDPEYDSIGSTEYTSGFIDECTEVPIKAKTILTTRFRYKLDEFNVVPKLLMCSNPSKGFLYKEFYMPFKKKKLLKYRKFVQALAIDNPYLSPKYIDNLKRADKNTKERLLFGNWEYDDDPTKLFEYDDIINLFTNTAQKSSQKYLIADIGRFGRDKTIIGYWEGLNLKKVWGFPKTSITECIQLLEKRAEVYRVKRSNVAVDEGGAGGGVVDGMEGIKGFIGSASPVEKEDYNANKLANYKNLRAQCFFYLADYVRKGLIQISDSIEPEIKQEIIEELEQIKQKDPDEDKKLLIISKKIIKERIGRSPDVSDMIMMRMYYELNPSRPVIIEFN